MTDRPGSDDASPAVPFEELPYEEVPFEDLPLAELGLEELESRLRAAARPPNGNGGPTEPEPHVDIVTVSTSW